jgi:hypothetical protein
MIEMFTKYQSQCFGSGSETQTFTFLLNNLKPFHIYFLCFIHRICLNKKIQNVYQCQIFTGYVRTNKYKMFTSARCSQDMSEQTNTKFLPVPDIPKIILDWHAQLLLDQFDTHIGTYLFRI